MELRRNPLKDIWVIFSPERNGRGGDISCYARTEATSDKSCPFCPGNEFATTNDIFSIKSGLSWSLRVFPNKYPALGVEGVLKLSGEGVYDFITGVGAHEVIVYSQKHNLPMIDHSTDIFFDLFTSAKYRMIDLEKDIRFSYLNFFINKGMNAGATMFHPHAQLLATPVLPKSIDTKLKVSIEYYNLKKRCICCDIIDMELSKGARVIDESSYFISFSDYASTTSFSISIYPKNHSYSFIEQSDSVLRDLSSIISKSFFRLGNLLDEPDCNLILYTSPTAGDISRNTYPTIINNLYHWHIEISPVLSKRGGAEVSGININTVLPEEAAKLLRGS